MAKGFTWTPDGSLPPILDHTRCKLNVIAQYLGIYLDTVSQLPKIDQLNISIVDGFCGGGVYRSDDGIVLGSPLVLLKAVEDAERRINEGRRKRLAINARYFFIDAETGHIAHLRKILQQYDYSPRLDDRITILQGAFETHLPSILQSISATQRKGRSIFLLDQCGYTDVHPDSLRRIFSELDGAEAILTFAIDALLNYLNDESLNKEMIQALGIPQNFIDEWKERYGNDLTRPLAQRTIMNQFHGVAKFMTPFMLRSQTDNRDMALIHLSNHQMARDKMLGVHWDNHNIFRHCGRGSLYALGFDHRLLEMGNALFSFGDNDRMHMHEELLIDLPAKIHRAIRDGGLPVRDLLNQIGNHTAARNEDICKVLQSLAEENELVITSSGGSRRRPSTLPQVGDVLETPAQRTFFSMLRNSRADF